MVLRNESQRPWDLVKLILQSSQTEGTDNFFVFGTLGLQEIEPYETQRCRCSIFESFLGSFGLDPGQSLFLKLM